MLQPISFIPIGRKMKNTILTLIILCFPLIATSQTERITELDKQQAELKETLRQQKEFTKREADKLKAEQEKVEAYKKQLAEIENYDQNFAQSRIVAIGEITETIKGFSIFQKMGAKAGFYKCLRKSLEESPKLDYDGCKNGVSLNADEQAQLNNWKATTGLSLNDTKILRETLPINIRNTENLIVTVEANRKFSEARENIILSTIETNENNRKELEMVPGLQKFINCDANTPEINLEEKVPYEGATFSGAFHGVPRDNQDGLGTCYANAAKNLLVGISEGKDVASFLDLALVYKNMDGSLNGGLDGGGSCPTLNAAKKTGYCPQSLAPLEGGERNLTGESLFNLTPYNYLATNVNLIRDFLEDINSFQKSSSRVSQETLSRSKYIIDAIKNNSQIELPMPVVRFEIPERWKLREAYSLHAPKTITEETFLKEYDEAYQKFFPNYIKAVMNGKNAEQVFDIYKEDLGPFISKYNLTNSLPEFKRVFKTNTSGDFADPKLNQKVRASVEFMKDLMNQKDSTDDEFFEFCSTSGAESLNFLSSLRPVLDKIKDNKLNDDQLFDKDGKFKSAFELMQLTVAPSCINKENRKELPAFTCSSGYDTVSKIRGKGKTTEDQHKMLREKVTLSLAQGYPVGNSFTVTSTSSHINTIVGMRFNKGLNRCEYLIRESQNGASDWHAESKILNKINALTEVRRSK